MSRATARRFFETECAPHAAEWERDGITARAPWLRAGELGLLGWEAPEKFGGQGVKDFHYNAIMTEEQQGARHGRHRYRPPEQRAWPPTSIDLTTDEQKSAVASRLRQRRDHHRDRDVRARRGL